VFETRTVGAICQPVRVAPMFVGAKLPHAYGANSLIALGRARGTRVETALA